MKTDYNFEEHANVAENLLMKLNALNDQYGK